MSRAALVLPAEGGTLLFGDALITAVQVVDGDPFYVIAPAV